MTISLPALNPEEARAVEEQLHWGGWIQLRPKLVLVT